MRIFKQMCIDFKSDVLFKDTLDYVEEVFEKLSITYDNMGFMFSGAYKNLDKIAEKYPTLKKYIKTHDENGNDLGGAMSSGRIDENGNYVLRVDKSEHEILRELVKKTPRPYSFGAISIFLDNVRWFPEIEMNTNPCLVSEFSVKRALPPSAYFPQSYMSNCVTLNKQFDNGKKFNPVWFTIEVSDEKNGIRDTTELENKLSDLFDKPFGTRYCHTKYHFYFDDEEKQYLAQQDMAFDELFEPLITQFRDLVDHAEGIQHLKKEDFFLGISRASGLSLVKALKKVLPAKEYHYQNDGGSSFTVKKKNENNHSFSLVCGLTPTYKKLAAGIIISGYNFKHQFGSAHAGQPMNCFGGIYPNTQEEVEYHVANLASALKKCEVELSDELLRLYGKSIL